MTTKSNWWHNATPEQKLAQIDGGIECGMTAAQVAMASRTSGASIRAYASFHGRKFYHKTKSTSAGVGRMAQRMRDRAAFLRGESIDLWAIPKLKTSSSLMRWRDEQVPSRLLAN